MPADFVKNVTEVEKTGPQLGEMLGEREVALLYQKDENVPPGIQNILRTDPAIPRRNERGEFFLPMLDWENGEWVERLTRMILEIERYLGAPAATIEIHSGSKENTLQSLIAAIRFIYEEHLRRTGEECRILVENKVGQAVADAEDMAMLWRMLTDNAMNEHSGVMLDIPNLHKATGKRFAANLEAIPNDSIRGMHVHWEHRTPSLDDPMDWIAVFEKLSSIDH